MQHAANPSSKNLKTGDDAAHSSIRVRQTLAGRVRYYWSLTAAALLLLVWGLLPIIVCRILRRKEWLYPWCLSGARLWLTFSGAKVKVTGHEHLDPQQPYVFLANHRSYLDTAALFAHSGRRIGVLAKKEILKVPILGYGMGFVNILAIDRSNAERARITTQAATDRIRSGVSYGVFAEGTRARPGQLLPFKKGGLYMARDAGVPVVPVAIKNTDWMMGKGVGAAYPGTIEMTFLPPVATHKDMTHEDLGVIADNVREQIAAVLAQPALTSGGAEVIMKRDATQK